MSTNTDFDSDVIIFPPPEEREEGGDGFILLLKCYSEIEAGMISTVLESGGIENILLPQNDSSFPLMGNMSVIKIFVKLHQYNDARAYVEDFYSGEENNDG